MRGKFIDLFTVENIYCIIFNLKTRAKGTKYLEHN